MRRTLSFLGFFLLLLGLAFTAEAKDKKHKEKPLKSNPGGAMKKWACTQLAEASCDVAKRCVPDKSLKMCRKTRERCDDVKDGPAGHATDDDVTSCAQAFADLGCKTVMFDSSGGVMIDLKKLDICATSSQDNLLPKPKDESGKAVDEGDKDKKDKDADE